MRHISRWCLLPLGILASCDKAPNLNPFSAHKPYPAQLVSNFVKFCKITGGAPTYCECVIEDVQKTVSLEDYNQMEMLLRLNPGLGAQSRAFKQLAASRLTCMQ